MKRDKEKRGEGTDRGRGREDVRWLIRSGRERDLIAAAGCDKDLVRAKTAAIIMAEKQNIEIRD